MSNRQDKPSSCGHWRYEQVTKAVYVHRVRECQECETVSHSAIQAQNTEANSVILRALRWTEQCRYVKTHRQMQIMVDNANPRHYNDIDEKQVLRQLCISNY